jgi:hypothetical protein
MSNRSRWAGKGMRAFRLASLIGFGLWPACHSSDGSVAPMHALTVVVTSGVAGNPSAGTQSVSESRSVSYSFSLKSGYKNLRVVIDGMAAQTTGSIVMDTDHLLYAEADSNIAPTAAQSLAISQTRAVLNSSDVLGAFKGLLQTEYNADRTGSATAAAAQRNVVSSLAFDQVRDAAALARVETSLNAAYFDLDFPSAILANTQSESAASILPISFIFVNGINNSYDDALSGMITTKRLIEEAGLPSYGWPQYSTKAFYVPNTDARLKASAYCWFTSAGLSIALGVPILSFFELANSTCGVTLDLIQSLADIRSLLQLAPVPELSQKLADSLRNERKKGRGVILIGHSRGTLVSQLALKGYLGAAESNPGSDLQRCVGFVSLAGPSPSQVGLRNVRNLFVKGLVTEDILLPVARIIDPTASGYRTNLSDKTDAEYPIVKSIIKENAAQIRAGLTLHNVVNSYLLDPIARDSVQKAIQRQVAALQSECVPAVTSMSLTAQPTDGISGVGLNPQPVVALRDKDGFTVGTASQSISVALSGTGGTLSGTLTASAVNGSATFQNLTINGSGTFRLVFSSPGLQSVTSSAFTIAPASCGGSLIAIPFSVNGSVTSGSCLVNGRRAQTYRFDVSSNGARQFTVNATFSPFMKIWEASGQGNYTVWTTTGTSLTLRWLLAAGSYVLGTGTELGGLGSFTLSGATAPENAGSCALTYLLQPASLQTDQSLTSSDCSLNGQPYDEYSFGGAQSCTVTITSTAFNPVLEVLDQSGGRVAIANAGTASSVRVSLPQCYAGTDGEFLFGVHSRVYSNQTTQSGPYRVTIQFGSVSAVRADNDKPILLGGASNR